MEKSLPADAARKKQKVIFVDNRSSLGDRGNYLVNDFQHLAGVIDALVLLVTEALAKDQIHKPHATVVLELLLEIVYVVPELVSVETTLA